MAFSEKVKSKAWFAKEFKKLKEEYLNDKEHVDETDIFLKETLKSEIRKLKKEVEKELTKKVVGTAVIYKLIDIFFKKAKKKQEDYMKSSIKTYYSKQQYKLAVGFGEVGTYVEKENKILNKIMNNPFKNSTFSARIHKNQARTKKVLKEEFEKEFKKETYNPKRIVRIVKKKLDITTFRAETLVRTELARMYSEIELESYRDLGIKEIEFMATLDNRTSHICRENDGNIIKVSEAKEGDNIPPLHPNCRSTTVAVTEFSITERMGRNLSTGKSEYMDSSIKNYKDYEAKYINWI
jgi:SPP1 gp7 family putative phage head morphogenesis protein